MRTPALEIARSKQKPSTHSEAMHTTLYLFPSSLYLFPSSLRQRVSIPSIEKFIDVGSRICLNVKSSLSSLKLA
jgi:hypothetical protein